MGPDQESYLDQVDLYLTDKQSIGATTYSLLCDLLAPEAKTKFASGRNICCTMEALRTDTSGDRRTFSFSKKGPDESLAEYDAALRKLATHCNFGAYPLRDRFVAGLRSEARREQ